MKTKTGVSSGKVSSSASEAITPPKGEKPKRLTPTPDTLRQLYLLSGNNCAMPHCDHLIIDGEGVVIGHVCHIEAALPDGARFNPDMSNEQRRAGTNLVLMCGGHHKQIDSKQHEGKYDLARVRKIKQNHEARFKGIGDSLRQAFKSSYADTTDTLQPTGAGSCRRLEKTLPDCRVDEEQAEERSQQLADYVNRMSKVPEPERDFMLGVIKRAVKLDDANSILVHIDDLKNALRIPITRMKSLGAALERYRVGDIDLYATDRGDEPHASIQDPSEYVSWFDIVRFCDETGVRLEEFVIRLKFGLLD